MAGPTTAERGTRPKSKSGRPVRSPSGRRLKRPFRLLIVFLCVIVLVSGGIWVLYGSRWLRAEDVRITGTEELTPAEVEAAAAVPIGSPLISVDTQAIGNRLGHKLLRIDSVDVSRSWPHGIDLKVTERKPALLIEKDAKFVEVDAKGVRFATVEKAPAGVPLLELTAAQSPSLRRFGTGRLTREAVRVRNDLPGEVSRQALAVQVRSYDSISLALRDGRTVMWGSSESGRAKARALSALMKAAPKARHFDVSAPTAPASSRS